MPYFVIVQYPAIIVNNIHHKSWTGFAHRAWTNLDTRKICDNIDRFGLPVAVIDIATRGLFPSLHCLWIQWFASAETMLIRGKFRSRQVGPRRQSIDSRRRTERLDAEVLYNLQMGVQFKPFTIVKHKRAASQKMGIKQPRRPFCPASSPFCPASIG